jgi:hypothetical protein
VVVLRRKEPIPASFRPNPRQRPTDSRGFGLLQVFVHSAEAQAATARDLAQPQAQFELQSQDLFVLRMDSLLVGKT